MSVTVAVLVVLGILVVSLYYLLHERQRLPPGPRGLPWLGTPPPNHHEEVVSLVKTYGKIFMLKFGLVKFVYISDFQLLRTAFNKLEFSDRPSISAFKAIKNGKFSDERLGVVTSSGDRWKHNRRFVLKSLRDLGMGKTKQEVAIQDEVNILLDCFAKIAGTPSKLPYEINLAFMNITKLLVSGERFSYENIEMAHLLRDVNKLEQLVRLSTLDTAFPFLHRVISWFIPDQINVAKAAFDFSLKFNASHQGVISEHMSTVDGHTARDFIDSYLMEMEKDKNNPDTMFHMDDLVKLMLDLFVAGNDTSANLFKSILLFLASFPRQQKMLQQQIDQVINEGEMPSLHHRDQLPGVEAFINEVARLAAPGLFGVFHATACDVELGGYHIPKGTFVFPTTSVIHRDPSYWHNPNQFEPERFLGEDGRLRTRDAFLPFGIGKRTCAGESMARMWMFILTSAVLQKFSISAPPGQYIDLTPERTPHKWNAKDQNVVFTLRQH